jgi:hypothetical protein
MQERTKQILLFKLGMVSKLGSAAFVLHFALIFAGESGNLLGLQYPDLLLLACMPLLFTVGLVLSFFKELSGGILMMLSIIFFNIVSLVQEGFSRWNPDFLLLLAASAVITGLGYHTQKR